MNISVVRRELAREMRWLMQDPSAVPSPAVMLARGLGWVPGIGFLVYVGNAFRTKARSVTQAEWFWLALSAAYVALLFAAERVVPRYYLPLWGSFAALGGIGWARIRPAGSARTVLRYGATIILAVGLLWHSGQGFLLIRRYGGPDHREKLVRFLDETFPDAFVAYDFTVNLPDPAYPERTLRGWVPRTRLYALGSWLHVPPDACPMNDLRRAGITHVAVNPAYVETYRIHGPLNRQGWGQFADAHHRLPFYEALMKPDLLVWHIPAGRLQGLAPALALYRLPSTSVP